MNSATHPARRPWLRVYRPSPAFTLIELLVAMTVFVIMGLLIMQILTATSGAVRMSNAQIDAAAQARVVFSIMAADLENSLLRRDMAVAVGNPPVAGDPFLKFFSLATAETPAGQPPGANRGLSLIGYRIAPSAGSADSAGMAALSLQRGAKALLWTDVGFFGLQDSGDPVPFGATGATVDLTNSDYDVIGEGVFHAWVGFQLKADGGSIPLSDGSTVTANGQIVESPPVVDAGNPALDRSAIQALVVALATTSLDARKLLSASDLESLRTRLSNLGLGPALAAGERPLSVWGPYVEDASNFNDLPKTAVESIRVFQRAFLLDPAPL